MNTTPTSGAAIQRYKICYHSYEWGPRSITTTSGIPDASGSWVRYADHVTALAAGQATAAPAQPVAQPGVAYAALPDLTSDSPLWVAIGRHRRAGFARDTTQAAMAVDAVVQDMLRAFADATCALRASHGQAPASVLHLVNSAFAEIAMTFPKAFALHKVGIADTAVREALAAPATAQADSVQEDAARYRWLRDGNDAKHGAAWHVAVNLYGCEWDAAIDAARKQGATP